LLIPIEKSQDRHNLTEAKRKRMNKKT